MINGSTTLGTSSVDPGLEIFENFSNIISVLLDLVSNIFS